MKMINRIINTMGWDKLLHMFLAGWISSMASLFGYTMLGITMVLILVLSVIKEVKYDSRPDWNDVLYSAIGIFVSVMVFVFKDLIS